MCEKGHGDGGLFDNGIIMKLDENYNFFDQRWLDVGRVDWWYFGPPPSDKHETFDHGLWLIVALMKSH